MRPRGSKKTPGSGRTAGTPNKRTQALAEAQHHAATVIADALGENAFTGDAHALLVAVYKDLRNPIDLRVDAAKAAIAYEKPRLASTELKGGVSLHEDKLAFLK
jgi:hypothetical protein